MILLGLGVGEASVDEISHVVVGLSHWRKRLLSVFVSRPGVKLLRLRVEISTSSAR